MANYYLDTDNPYVSPLIDYILKANTSGDVSAAGERLVEVMVEDWGRNLLDELEALLAEYQRGARCRASLRECLFDTIREWHPLDWLDGYLRHTPARTSTQHRRRSLGFRFLQVRDRYALLETAKAAGDNGATGCCRKDLREAIDDLLYTYDSKHGHRHQGRARRLLQRRK